MCREIKTAFVLAAGYGKRLRPLTDITPKPLLPIGETSPLFLIFDKLVKIGVKKIIVNTHHLPEAFEKALSPYKIDGKIFYKGAEIITIFEPEILDTGGGIKNASEFLKDEDAFLVHNGDILFSADIATFAKEATKRLENPDVAAALCLRANGAIKNVGIKEGFVRDMRSTTGKDVEEMAQFSGVFVAGKKFLEKALTFSEKSFSTVDVFIKLIQDNEDSVASIIENKGTWSDIGTPAQYLKSCKNKRDLFALLAKLAEFEFIAKDVKMIDKGASSRIFLRFTDEQTNEKLVACFYNNTKREDFLYADIAKFLDANKIPVPKIIKSCKRRRIMVMSDGGNIDLLDIAKTDINKSAYFYGLAIESARILHTKATDAFKKKPFELSQPFNEDLYNWEQNYFKQETLIGKFGLNTTDELERELNFIKQTLLKEETVLLFRDFQSQNIMISDEKISLIDFQGMRLGCAMYDVASLLFDPYVWLPDDLINDLLRLYFRGKPTDNQLKIFYIAACQRLLQALGAYGFLSIKRGKTEYVKYFEPALKRLEYCAKKANLRELKKIFYMTRPARAGFH